LPTPLSRRQHHRLRSLGLRLWAVLEQLDAITERKAPLAPAIAGPALRTLGEAHRYANLPPLTLSNKRLMPGELFAETLSALLHLRTLNTLSRKASQATQQKSYPRRSKRA
jgi:hypothetical protein